MPKTRVKHFNPAKPNTLPDDTARFAMIVASAIRNALEEIHGGGNPLDHTDEGGTDGGLTDEQMRMINPIVRNTLATAFHAMDLAREGNDIATMYLGFHKLTIPDYWEPCELTEDFAK